MVYHSSSDLVRPHLVNTENSMSYFGDNYVQTSLLFTSYLICYLFIFNSLLEAF